MRWFPFSREGSSSFLSAGYKLAAGFLMLGVGKRLGTSLCNLQTYTSSPWFPRGTSLVPSSISCVPMSRTSLVQFPQKNVLSSHTRIQVGYSPHLPDVGWESIYLSVPYTDLSTLSSPASLLPSSLSVWHGLWRPSGLSSWQYENA